MTDIQPGNFMFTLLKPLNYLTEEDLLEYYPPCRWTRNIQSLERIDGKPLDKHSPQEIMASRPLETKIIDRISHSSPRIVITDLGCGMSVLLAI